MEKDVQLKLADRLRQLRKKYKYTQWKLSELAEVDYKHIQLLESKKPSAAKIDTLQKLAKAFNITLSKLLDFK
ncbi:MAG: helix-turn-helix domain-containing protein [Candidatus Omnitrophica bacterium]|nr:helix-turn-helix domain-containing protein [Candidatus Omnitrophota bacterium]